MNLQYNSKIQNIQSAAHVVWQELTLPTIKDENYRYFNVKNISVPKQLSGPHGKSVQESVDLPDGVYFGPLSEALNKHEWSEKIFSAAVNYSPAHKADYFSMLIVAQASEGLCLYVPENITVELPLRALVSIGEDSIDGLCSRLLIVLEKNAKATVVQEFTSTDSAQPIVNSQSFVGVYNQIVLGPGAVLNFHQAQTLNNSTQLLLRSDVQQDSDSLLTMAVVHVGGGRVQSMFEGHLHGSGAVAKIDGAVRGSGIEVYDFWATLRHTAPSTQSVLNYRAVMGGASKAIFNGNVVITPEAKGTVAEQRNRNMLISPTAEVVSTPKLEIACEDVKCVHGATVSSVSEDQLMYMQSRGISRSEAEQMIVHGFTEPVLIQIPIEEVRERIENLF